MESLNWTRVSQFYLLGITDHPQLQLALFAMFFLLFVTTLVGNFSTVAVVISDQKLHTPMYFFLGNLSLLDVFYSSVTVPKMLNKFRFDTFQVHSKIPKIFRFGSENFLDLPFSDLKLFGKSAASENTNREIS
uniref:G-protein coupled receptors family 1 profile domain-containing protein n=1 Tax=Leptobrachium leishanense TaxID=445787 RepID=A0A8C5MEQ5_9ANUR